MVFEEKKYSISEILKGSVKVDQLLVVQGWVKTRRDSKAGFSFVMLNDGSCFSSLQLVVPSNLSNYSSDVLRLTAGCSVRARGKLVQSPGKGQSFEIQVDHLEVLGWVEDPDTYPISPKHHTVEYLREYGHLRPRTNVFGAVSRVRDCLAQAVHRFFHDNGFYWVHTPLITTSDCEGAGEMFRVSTLDLLNIPKKPDGMVDFDEDFFGKETFLTVSGQLNLEAYCCALSKVYTFGPSFRAEKSFTTRHLAEFWMIEPEIAFADLKENAQWAEALLKSTCKALLEERMDDMAFFQKHVDANCINRVQYIIDQPFEYMTYTEAVSALEKSTKQFEFPVRWGMDLQSEHERYLAEELVGRPVVVMNYPKEIKSFYMRVNDDGKTVAAMDILAPGIGEIIGGSQREERLDRLDQRIEELGLNKDSYWWYRDLRRYGTVPHSGFGLGFDRYVCYVTGIANIRDAIPFPRTTKQADF